MMPNVGGWLHSSGSAEDLDSESASRKFNPADSGPTIVNLGAIHSKVTPSITCDYHRSSQSAADPTNFSAHRNPTSIGPGKFRRIQHPSPAS
jgi:hypothetical protein